MLEFRTISIVTKTTRKPVKSPWVRDKLQIGWMRLRHSLIELIPLLDAIEVEDPPSMVWFSRCRSACTNCTVLLLVRGSSYLWWVGGSRLAALLSFFG